MAKKVRPRLFERLKQGLEEGIAHARGEIELVTRKVSTSLPPPPRAYGPADVAAVRERLRMGQVEFALIFCVSAKTVQSWEQGVRSPSPAATRLLQVLEDPKAMESLRELSTIGGAG
jgi:putative transcriptional regulator